MGKLQVESPTEVPKDTVFEATGTCFEDVTEEFIRLLAEKRHRWRDGTLFMVHGICLLPNTKAYSHAWIELDGKINFCGKLSGQKLFVVVEKEEFETVFQVQEFTRYTPEQAYKKAKQMGDIPPPWELKYFRLCRDWDEKLLPLYGEAQT